MRQIFGIIIFLFSSYPFCVGQNIISVPFPNGFVGISSGNNSADSCYYHSGAQGLNWTDVRFAQTTNGNVFVEQGNDIVGEVWITDDAGIEWVIPGFIKWRTPSGNDPHTMVFQPSPGTYILATNGFNGSTTYTIDENSYIGLTKLGSTLTIDPVPGTVTGNSSTSGLLDALNDILGDIPHLEVTGDTVAESAGTAQVTVNMDTASANTVIVHFYTYSSSAETVNDYDSTAHELTFAPGETQKTINITITVDAVGEATEFFYVRIHQSTNAAIVTSENQVYITDQPLPVSLVSFNLECEKGGFVLSWTTASEYNSDRFEVEKSVDGYNWILFGYQSAQGNSSNLVEYEFIDYRDNLEDLLYYRIKQVDLDGQFDYSPTIASDCIGKDQFVSMSPNPAGENVHVSINLKQDEPISLNIINLRGSVVYRQEVLGHSGSNLFDINIQAINNDFYLVQISTSSEIYTERLQVLH